MAESSSDLDDRVGPYGFVAGLILTIGVILATRILF